jgi:predicted transcriptional regulator of viral defense system
VAKPSSGDDYHRWRFVTNHAHVLQTVARDPTIRVRDIADTVGITERTAAHIVNDLEKAGYLSKLRNGRRNHYEIHEQLPLRHPQHGHHTVGELIRFLQAPAHPRAQLQPQRRTRR